MTLPVVLTASARTDIRSADKWYQSKQVDLGVEFTSELDHLINRMGAHPYQFPLAHKDLRRATLRRFPYAVLFRVLPDLIQVVACLHTNRDPDYWKARS